VKTLLGVILVLVLVVAGSLGLLGNRYVCQSDYARSLGSVISYRARLVDQTVADQLALNRELKSATPAQALADRDTYQRQLVAVQAARRRHPIPLPGC
jgi:hypothetical protein